MSSIDPELLVHLGRHRWAVAVIAMLADRNGARFIELLHGLATNRESLTRTLDSCMASGWVMRNPGHGHPLRPEYILTDPGWQAAPLCQAIEDARRGIGLPPASFSRWSLPIVRQIDLGVNRFNAIGHNIARANPRALTQSLKALVGQSVVVRTIVDDYPPVPEYGLTDDGQRLAVAMR